MVQRAATNDTDLNIFEARRFGRNGLFNKPLTRPLTRRLHNTGFANILLYHFFTLVAPETMRIPAAANLLPDIHLHKS